MSDTHHESRDTEQWQFEEGDTIVEDEVFSPSFEGAGKVTGTEYEVARRLVDSDTEEQFYWVEYEDGPNVNTQLKSASMVHDIYRCVDTDTERSEGAD